MYFLALGLIDIGEIPGGAAIAFCAPVIHTSMFHLSTGNDAPPSNETESTMYIESLRDVRSETLSR